MGQKPETILVADDEPGVREFIARTLEQAGYRVIAVDSGSAALRTLASTPVELLVCDVVMPDVDGLETIATARKLHPRLPILAISGGGEIMPATSGLTQATLLGAQATLEKPFDYEDLTGVVQLLLEERDGTAR